MVMIIICFLAPWLAMFLRGKIFQGIVCIILHLTLIGWIPAAIWAVASYREDQAEKRHREMLRVLRQQ